jgi:glucosamine--fructose-6-phosphate aminotransferase (isomerizing)
MYLKCEFFAEEWGAGLEFCTKYKTCPLMFEMPVIVVAPNNELLEKLKSNVEEVRARGGIMYVFADKEVNFKSDETMRVINVPHCEAAIAPIVYTLPLQLLSDYVAVIKGTDVDQLRNLAKSVTVE